MNINFEKQNGLVPAIIQDSVTLNVLMLGYMTNHFHKKSNILQSFQKMSLDKR